MSAREPTVAALQPWETGVLDIANCECAGPQPLKCVPVHPLWPCRERRKQVDTAAQSHPDLPRLAQAAMQRRLLLAFIGQAIAPAAGK